MMEQSTALFFGFENLKVWQQARGLTADIFRLTGTEGFPEVEKFTLGSQMKRASLSIASNIAEGTSRFTHKERARYITIAYGSAVELMNQLILSKDLDYITEEQLTSFRAKINEICAMLTGLKKSIHSP